MLKTTAGKRLFDAVARRVVEQAFHPREVVDSDHFKTFPLEAHTVCWLWLFQCEAGVCGKDVFIPENLAIYSPQIHAALSAVGAADLVHLLEAASGGANSVRRTEMH